MAKQPTTDRATDAPAAPGAGPVTAAEFAEFSARLAVGAGSDELLGVSPGDLCDLISGLERIKNAAAAAQARATDTVVTKFRDQAIADGVPANRRDKGIRLQVGLARRESPHAGSRQIGFAQALVHEMPHTHAAMTAGLLSEWTAKELVRETACLTREQRIEADARLVDRLRVDSHKKLVAAGRALAYELDPHAFVNRGRRATKDRRVSIRPAPDVMAIVSGHLPVAQGVACYKALDESARSLKSDGDERSLDQLRADLFIERLTGRRAADNPNIEVGLVMTDGALLGLEETAARLECFGPIPAGLARDLVQGTDPTATTPGDDASSHSSSSDGLLQQAMVWLRRLYADPVTGVLCAQDERKRLFSGALRRFLVARDQVCRTPWCDAPVRHADHILAFARGGTTTEGNGQGTCEACNYEKEAPGFRYETLESRKGRHVVRVTTPTGHTYESHAPPVLPTLGLARGRPPSLSPPTLIAPAPIAAGHGPVRAEDFLRLRAQPVLAA